MSPVFAVDMTVCHLTKSSVWLTRRLVSPKKACGAVCNFARGVTTCVSVAIVHSGPSEAIVGWDAGRPWSGSATVEA